MKHLRFASLLVILSLILAACAPATAPAAPTTAPTAAPTAVPTEPPAPTATPEPTAAPLTIVDIAAADERFSTLVAAVQAAGLVETLSGEGPFTVFAPTNDAFAQLPEGTLDTLLMPENKQQLTDILTYHVVAGKVMAADVVNLSEAETVLGEKVAIKTDMGKVFINEAEVVITDIEAANGVIHVIDSVILPAAAAAEEAPAGDIVAIAAGDERFKTLVAAVQAAGLVETLQGEGPFTVFAPTDEAFAKLPAGTLDDLLKPENQQQLIDILTYHVVPGKVMAADVVSLSEAETALGEKVAIKTDMDKVYINDAQVILTDIEASNGVIHVIDSVILPGQTAALDIVDTAVADGRFTTLAAALEAGGLIETLKGEGPFTVFAPTDEAFAKLPAGTLDTLLDPANQDQLVDILTYHVVSGKVMAGDVVKLESADTVQGQPVSIKVENDKVFINEAEVLITDIETSNGVIHVIDSVILPPQ